MSLESVRRFFAEKAPDLRIIELETSTATVALAAEAHGVEPGRIAKTLSLRVGERTVLVVARGDARLDNRKIKAAFGGKAKMLGAEDVVELTGHPVGGVCPFGLATPLACTATSRCKPSTKCFRPPGRCTARSASPRNGWPSWWMRSGSMCARKSSRKPDGNCRAQARLSCQDTPKRSASQAKRWLKP